MDVGNSSVPHKGVQFPCLKYYEIKEKIKEINLEKYGVEYISQSPEIQEKIKKTNLEKYGNECYTKTDDYRKKTKQTNLEKYGVENISQTDEYKKKCKITKKIRFYESNKKNLLVKNIEILNTKDEYIHNDEIYYRCLTCNTQFKTKELNNQSVFCPNCIKKHYSIREKELLEWIKSIYSGKIVENNRTILNGKELDIYIPDKKLAIEFNGDYWHREEKVGIKYHQEKTLACKEQGIRLIHVFENEWYNKQEICKSIIKFAIGIYDTVIYARKCIVKEISSNEYKNFLDLNHLQGSVNSSIRLGLFYNDELVSVIGFGKSRFKKDEIELHRFCCKLNYFIPGAFSKLIKHSNVNKFITYVELAHFTGDGYKSLGFKELSVTEPNYKWVKYNSILNRFQTQKHKLAKLLENYDKNLTEMENMEMNGYWQIFDSGNLKLMYSIS